MHGVVGSPWGNPSYIQPTYFDAAQFAGLAGELKRALSIPVVHTGRVNGPAVAERVLAAGHADVVGVARAHIAEARVLDKARTGRESHMRPCVGGNECISRRYVEGLGFACAVNPGTSHEVEGLWPRLRRPRRLLVIGGGPAGMELAALTRDAGFSVELQEAGDSLGGQLRYAAMAPRHEMYAAYLDWQRRRLSDLGVKVRLGSRTEIDDVIDVGADVVAVATGATPRTPDIPGVDRPSVVDVRDVLADRATVGHRVLVVAQDNHVAPLSVADHLSTQGHRVTVTYATAGPAPLLGRYIIGGILGRLDAQDVRMRFMEEVVAVDSGRVRVRNVYSLREETVDGFDTVVLACGSVSDSSLYDELRASGSVAALHLLGDAYAPRRLVFATKRAYALAELLVRDSAMSGAPTLTVPATHPV